MALSRHKPDVPAPRRLFSLPLSAAYPERFTAGWNEPARAPVV
jgi:hypothetical protein